MNTKLIAGGALTGLVLAGGVAGMVSAQSAAVATGLTEAQIIEIALSEVSGEVTEVERDMHCGDDVFEVEVVTADGTEVEVYIAAASGDVLNVEADGDGCDQDDAEDDEAEDEAEDDAEDETEDA